VFKALVAHFGGTCLAAPSDWPGDKLDWGCWHMFRVEA
jgi:hypothetical protein